MKRKNVLRDRIDCTPSCIVSLHGNAFLIDVDADGDVDEDGDIPSVILLSLRSILRRLLRYVSTDDDEIKLFEWLL